MITRKMIKKGFENEIISIEDDYAGCMGICCKIGDNAFYFRVHKMTISQKKSIGNHTHWI